MTRVFNPLPADHPAIGRLCARCTRPFVIGDRTSLVGKPGRERGGLTVEADLVHATCAVVERGTSPTSQTRKSQT